jgi:hypothetical protein
MKGEEVSEILFKLISIEPKYGSRFISSILVNLQDWDDVNFGKIFSTHPELEEHF